MRGRAAGWRRLNVRDGRHLRQDGRGISPAASGTNGWGGVGAPVTFGCSSALVRGERAVVRTCCPCVVRSCPHLLPPPAKQRLPHKRLSHTHERERERERERAVGGRASSALISIVKASLRAVFRGGSFVDGCGTAAQSALRRCLRLLRRAACCSRRWRKTRLVAHQELMLWRDVRRMRPGGGAHA